MPLKYLFHTFVWLLVACELLLQSVYCEKECVRNLLPLHSQA